MIILLIVIGAALVSYLVLDTAITHRDARDRKVFMEAFKASGGHRYRDESWREPNWCAMERWGQERRAEVQAADARERV